jgi:hypothetical protein
MFLKTLIAVAVSAAFATGAFADDKKASSGGTADPKANKGAEQMFKSLDKNKDGNLSREEVKGTPHDKDFSTLDKNNDGKLTREEHAAAPEHQQADKSAAKSGSSGAAGGTSSSGSSAGSAPAKKY